MIVACSVLLIFTSVLAVHAAVSDCFYIKAAANGKNLNYVNVLQPAGNKNYVAEFGAALSSAPKFGIQAKSGEVRVYSTGNNVNGRRAAIARKSTSAFLIFDTKTSLLLQNRAPLKCSVSPSNALACVAGDNAAVNVFQDCTDYWSIGDRVRTTLGCLPLTLQAVEAQGCGNFSVGLAP